jgi:hypothetical protein
MWFCRSAFGPAPSSTISSASLNGFEANSVRLTKNALIANNTTIAQPTSASLHRPRYLYAIAAV